MAPKVKRSRLMAFKVTPLEARYIDAMADQAEMKRSVEPMTPNTR